VDGQNERLAIHRHADEQAAADAAVRRFNTLRHLLVPAGSAAECQAQLRMLAGHLEALGFRVDRSGGHDAWKIYDGSGCAAWSRRPDRWFHVDPCSLFAADFATKDSWQTPLVGLAAALGAGISIGFAG
jgi:hypothetical protein